MGAIVALLIGSAFLAVYKKPVLGLDLRGGLEVILQATPETKSQPITPQGMQTA
jgi:preprotein translocase subunit SecD